MVCCLSALSVVSTAFAAVDINALEWFSTVRVANPSGPGITACSWVCPTNLCRVKPNGTVGTILDEWAECWDEYGELEYFLRIEWEDGLRKWSSEIDVITQLDVVPSDLVVSMFNVTKTSTAVSDCFEVNVTVENIGVGTAAIDGWGCPVYIYATNNSGGLVDYSGYYFLISMLYSGYTESFQMVVPADVLGLGTWNLFIVIDPDSWLVESNKGNNNSAPVTVTVQPPEYYITATASAGGRIHPLGRLPAPTCEPMYFFAWPDEGYEIEGWYVDGVLRDSGMGTYFTYYDSLVEDGVD